MKLDIGIKFGSHIQRVEEVIGSAVPGAHSAHPERPAQLGLIEFGGSGIYMIGESCWQDRSIAGGVWTGCTAVLYYDGNAL